MEREEFNKIIHRDNKKLFILAYRMLKNQQEAEDVVQEVFVRLWDMRDKLDTINNLTVLELSITRNKCIDVLRRWKFTDPDFDSAALSLKETDYSPHEKIVSEEDLHIVRNIIHSLPSPYKENIIMREIDGLSYNEITEITGVNVNSLRVNISRARQMIKEKYADLHRI